jgi:hypothetical protein
VKRKESESTMTTVDMTNELAPLIWTLEGLMLVALVWLVAMLFAEQTRPTNYRVPGSIIAPDPEPTVPDVPDEPASDSGRRLAA